MTVTYSNPLHNKSRDTALGPSEYLPSKHDSDLKCDELPQSREVWRCLSHRHHGIEDKLTHPERGNRDKRAQQPQHYYGSGEAPMSLPHELNERGNVAECSNLHTLWRRFVRPMP
jgi:hypothetical protein